MLFQVVASHVIYEKESSDEKGNDYWLRIVRTKLS